MSNTKALSLRDLTPTVRDQVLAIRAAKTWDQLLVAARAQWDYPVGTEEHRRLCEEVTLAKTQRSKSATENGRGADMTVVGPGFALREAWH